MPYMPGTLIPAFPRVLTMSWITRLAFMMKEVTRLTGSFQEQDGNGRTICSIFKRRHPGEYVIQIETLFDISTE